MGIGYGLDVLFGTLPICLVIFALLGFAAGVKTMLRTAEQMRRRCRGRPAVTKRGRERG
jgi:ATP synthase protein I